MGSVGVGWLVWGGWCRADGVGRLVWGGWCGADGVGWMWGV